MRPEITQEKAYRAGVAVGRGEQTPDVAALLGISAPQVEKAIAAFRFEYEEGVRDGTASADANGAGRTAATSGGRADHAPSSGRPKIKQAERKVDAPANGQREAGAPGNGRRRASGAAKRQPEKRRSRRHAKGSWQPMVERLEGQLAQLDEHRQKIREGIDLVRWLGDQGYLD